VRRFVEAELLRREHVSGRLRLACLLAHLLLERRTAVRVVAERLVAALAAPAQRRAHLVAADAVTGNQPDLATDDELGVAARYLRQP